MIEQEYRPVEFVLASSRPLDAYGGIELPEDMLEELAAGLVAGKLPMNFNHDLRRPINVRDTAGWTERDDDGYLIVKGTMEIAIEDWEVLQAEFDEAGVPGGMSFTFTSLLERFEQAGQNATQDEIWICCEASHFDADEVAVSARALSGLAAVEARELYQFNAEYTALVVLAFETGLPAVSWNLISSYLYAALSRLRRARGKTQFQFTVHDSADERFVSATLETSDSEVLKEAISAFGAIAGSAGRYDFDQASSSWSLIGNITKRLPRGRS